MSSLWEGDCLFVKLFLYFSKIEFRDRRNELTLSAVSAVDAWWTCAWLHPSSARWKGRVLNHAWEHPA